MPEPTLLRLEEITHVGFVDVGANQEDDEGAFIEIWKRADHPQEKRKMAEFDTKDLSEDAQKAFAELQEAAKKAEEATETAEAAAKESEERATKAAADLAEATKKEEPKDDDVLKGLPEDVQKALDARQAKSDEAIAKAQDQADAATKAAEAATIVAKAECEKRERKEFADIAKADLSGLNIEGLGDQLYDTSKVMEADAFEAHLTTLKAASTQANLAAVLSESGKTAAGTIGGAWDEVEALAKVMVDKNEAPTKEQAIAKVLDKNPELFDRYNAEQRDA